MINLNEYIELHNFSAEEITIILNSITGGSTISQNNPNLVLYVGGIEVLFKSNSKEIRSINIPHKYWKENKSKIIESFSSALNPHSEKIVSRVVFTQNEELSIPPFKWNNDFQLGRMIEGNPKPDYLMALHPCLFQFKVPITNNISLNNFRFDEIFKQRFLPLLPILRQFGVTNLQYDAKTSSTSAWALVQKDRAFESKYLQLDYFINDEAQPNSFGYHKYLQPLVKQLPVYKTDIYWLSAENISIVYSIYELLNNYDKEMFLLGCEWFNKAITANESTDQFLFIMIMLEIFLPKDTEICDSCSQNIYSINKKFKTFIPEIIGEGWTTNFDKVLGKLYNLRSDISHNGVAVAERSLGLIPNVLKEENQVSYAFDLARQFLISWLVKKHNDLN